jgi:WS/DGAT/MGAT family acyltransferase
VPSAQPWAGEHEPNPLELVFRAQINTLTQPWRLAEVMARTVPAMGRLGLNLMQRRFETPAVQPPRTRFNRQVTAHRIVEGRRFELAQVKTIKQAVPGATVNDAVLAIVGGALRIYLEAKLELPKETLIAMAPISVRGEGERGALGNQVAGMTVALGTQIADPVERLRAVHEAATASKSMTHAVGAKLMTDYTQFIPSTTAALATRVYTEYGLSRQVSVPFNCVVTNVPGPQIPLYSAGARLVTQFGMGPIFDGMGLIFPVFSYCGWVMISMTSCREMVPDPEFFGDCLDASFQELRAASENALAETAQSTA